MTREANILTAVNGVHMIAYLPLANDLIFSQRIVHYEPVSSLSKPILYKKPLIFSIQENISDFSDGNFIAVFSQYIKSFHKSIMYYPNS